MEKKHVGRGIAGFFTTLFLFGFIIIFVVVGTLRFSLFNCDTVSEFLNQTKFYDSASDIISEEICREADKVGLSEDVVKQMMTDKLIIESTDNILKCLENKKEVDMSFLKDKLSDYSENASQVIVNTVIDEIEKQHIVLDENALRNIDELKQFSEDYDVDAVVLIVNTMQDEFHTEKIEITDKNKEKFKNKAANVINKQVEPAVDKLFDQCINEMNKAVNEAIGELDKEYGIYHFFDMFKQYMRMMKVVTVILLIVIVILIGLEFIIYRKELYRGFKHTGGALLTSGIIGIILCIAGFVTENFAIDTMSNYTGKDELIIKAVSKFTQYNIKSVLNMLGTITAVLVVAGIIFKIVASNFKKKVREKRTL